MKKTLSLWLGLAAIICIINTLELFAGSYNKISEVSYKASVYDNVSKDELQGRVVSLMVYDIATNKVEMEIEEWAKLRAQYRFDAAEFVAFPNIAASEALLENTAVAYGLKCALLSGVTSSFKPEELPAFLLFDHEGNHVKTYAHAKELKNDVAKLLKNAPNVILGTEDWSTVSAEAKKVEAMKALGKVCKDLAKIAEGDKAEAAGKLLARTLGYGEAKLKRIENMVKSSLVSGCEELKALTDLYKGCDFGEQLEARLKELSATQQYVEETKALKVAEDIRKAMQRVDPANPDNATLDTLIKKCDLIINSYKAEYEGVRVAQALTKRLNELKEVNPDAGGGGYDSGDGGSGGGKDGAPGIK